MLIARLDASTFDDEIAEAGFAWRSGNKSTDALKLSGMTNLLLQKLRVDKMQPFSCPTLLSGLRASWCSLLVRFAFLKAPILGSEGLGGDQLRLEVDTVPTFNVLGSR